MELFGLLELLSVLSSEKFAPQFKFHVGLDLFRTHGKDASKT